MRICKWAACIALVALIGAGRISPTFAQLTRGFISGVINDPSGGVLTGVQVTVTNKETNISRQTTTNEAGFYRFSAVEPGSYSVEFKQSGFETRKVDPVSVATAQEVTINQVLTVGGITSEVSVTEVPGADLAKASATIERTFSGSLVENLPLFTLSSGVRDVTRVALLAPNAVRAPGQNGFAVNGQRNRNNNFMLDAIDNNDYAVTLDAARVMPEAISEVQVQTSSYSAEFGRNSGAQFSAVTKSGTNQFHGEGWEFYRGNFLEPINLPNKRAGIKATPRFVFNEFGGDVGGPIINNRTFFFGLADWSRRREAPDARNAASTNVPTPAGYAALQNIPLASGQTQASRQAVLSALSFLPQVYPSIANYGNLQNISINGTPVQIGSILIPLPKPYSYFSNTVRLDHKLSTKDDLMYRYYIDDRDQPNVTGNLQFGTRWAAAQKILRQNHAISYTRILSPRFLNEARFAYVRSNVKFAENDPVSPTVTISGTGGFNFGGISAFPQGRFDHTWQFQDVVSGTIGRHAMKFGLDLRRYWLFSQTDTNSKGTWAFQSLADFINNQAQLFTQAVKTSSFVATEWDQAYFIQDDFRAAKNLTLNLGLRYQYYTLPLDMLGTTDPTLLAAGIPGPARPDKTNWAPRFGFAYSPSGSGLLGNGKTVVRGGFGVQYDVIYYNVLTNIATNYPHGITNQIQSPSTFNLFPTQGSPTAVTSFSPMLGFISSPADIKHPATELWSLSIQREFGSNYILEVGYSGNRSYHEIRQTQANPPVLTADQAALVIANPLTPTIIPGAQARRLNPNWGSRTVIESTAKGAYEAGYIKFDRRLTRNLMIGANYTFSGTWSDNDELISGITDITNSSPAPPEDFFNYRKEWSRSAFDHPQRLAVTYLYRLPWFSSGWASGALSKVMGGWQISGFTEAQSGQPFTILTGVDTAGVAGSAARPNYNPNGTFMPNYSLTAAGPIKQDYSGGGLRTFYTPVDGSGIVTAPRGPNGILTNSMPGGGNLGRNTFRGPGFQQWNFSLLKSVKVHENMQLEVRSDFSNVWNHRNFPNPVTTMSSTTFGQNTGSMIGDGVRSILLNAKLRF